MSESGYRCSGLLWSRYICRGWHTLAFFGTVATHCGGSVDSNRPTKTEMTLDASVPDARSSDGSVPTSDGSSQTRDAGPEASACYALPSNYDQSCVADTDCAPVSLGPLCTASPCSFCPNGVIGRNAEADYNQAYNAILANVDPSILHDCNCGGESACCQDGQCKLGSDCAMPEDAGAQSNDDASYLDYTVLCVEDAGIMDSGSAISGASRWCNGPERCMPFNGGWECCATTGPVVTCVPP